MATISENLQTIKDSTDAIKQAIIDKGGTIEGDITTWASAINAIQAGGGSSDEEYIFTGSMSYNMTKVIVTGSLNKIPVGVRSYLLSIAWYTGGLCYGFHFLSSTGPYTLTCDFKEPTAGAEVPALCILQMDGYTHTIIPVKFIQK